MIPLAAVLGSLLAAVLLAWGVVLQWRGLPRTGDSAATIAKGTLRNPTWLAGIAASAAGTGVCYAALAFGPLVVVQPLVAAHLALIPLFARRGERLTRLEAGGIALVLAGVAAIAAATAFDGASALRETDPSIQALLAATACVALFHLAPSRLLAPSVSFGLSSGAGFALAAIFWHAWSIAPARWPLLGAFAAAYLVGFVQSQRGFRRASASAVTASSAGAAAVLSALAGIWLFGEAGGPARIAGLSAIVLGVVLLAQPPMRSTWAGQTAGSSRT